MLGLFYTVVGTGEMMRVSTPCSGGTREQSFSQETNLEVFAGDCSHRRFDLEQTSSHTCSSSGGEDNWVSWQSIKDEVYFVHVTSNGDTGPFSFSVTEVPP